MVTKATRITKTSKTLIDHITTNAPKRITYTEVLPCPLVSDLDAPFVCLRIIRYAPRYKLIRNEKRFSESASIKDFAGCSALEIVYAFDDPNDKIVTFNRIVAEENKGDPSPRALVKLSEYSLPASTYTLRKSTPGSARTPS